MLRLSPIRIKLRIAMAVLSVVFGMSAASGLWGLYQFKKLANELGRQADQNPLANRLHTLAMTMRDSHLRSATLRGRGGPPMGLAHGVGGIGASILSIDATAAAWNPLTAIESSERHTFDSAATILASSSQRLRQMISASDGGVLVPRRKRLDLLDRVDASLATIHANGRLVRPLSSTDHADQLRLLDRLVADSETLSTGVHAAMGRFSEDVRTQYRTCIAVAWTATATAFVLIPAVLFAFRSYVVKPFRTLLDGARLVTRGQYEHKIFLGTNDELGELAAAINAMTTHFLELLVNLDAEVRLRTSELVRNEQLASVGFLAAGVAHEINNPLAAVAWSAESLQNQVTGADIRGVDDDDEQNLSSELHNGLQLIESEAYRCKGIIEKLLDFSRLGETKRESHDIRGVVDDIVAMVGKVGRFRCMNIRVTGDAEANGWINPQEIRQVILNLLTNALESVDDQGEVNVDVGRRHDRVCVTVRDNGCGMTDEVLEHLFEPFFTRRRDGSGTGLGLSITARIVCDHGGSLKADSDGPGRGSTFRLELPTSADALAEWTPPPAVSAAA